MNPIIAVILWGAISRCRWNAAAGACKTPRASIEDTFGHATTLAEAAEGVQPPTFIALASRGSVLQGPSVAIPNNNSHGRGRVLG